MAKPFSSEIIRTARGLIAKERNWCRGAYARDAAGRLVVVSDGSAVRRCAMGALACGLSLWVAYGTIRGDIVIIAANTVSLCLLTGILFFKLRGRESPTD
jgi:hypothetical protein